MTWSAGLKKGRLELRGEVGDALGSEYTQYLKKSGEGDNSPDVSATTPASCAAIAVAAADRGGVDGTCR
jgi:hypothetical protein